MITEDYVSFETAKLLKEKGFDESTIMRYDSNGEISSDGRYGHYNSLKKFDFISAPTLQMAMKWLREVHNLEIYPSHDNFQEHHSWWFDIYKFSKGYSGIPYESNSIYPTYEEACEAAIRYCLENLI